jgi:transposase
VSQRTSLSKQTRGLLSEYGVVIPAGFKSFKQTLAVLSDPNNSQLSVPLKQQIRYVAVEFDRMCIRLKELNQTLADIAQNNPHCQRLMSIPGIGYINATALYSTIGNGGQFTHEIL